MNSNNIPRKWKMKVTPELSKRVQEIVFRSARGWIDKGTIIQGLYMPWLVYDRGFLLAANNTAEIKEEFHEISAYAYITTNGRQKWLPNYGDECLVSSDDIKWYEAKYCSYIPDSEFPVIVDSRTSYKFVKKAIQKTYADFVSFLDELDILYKFSDNCETALKNSEGYKKWVDDKDHNIYNPHWNIELDFERPDIAINEIIDLVEKTIEPNSPLGCELGKNDNIGEGIVATFLDENGNLHRFKVKGEEHRKGSGKIKKLNLVDSVKEQAKVDFVNKYAATESRLQQMFTEIVHNGDVEMKDMGQFLRLVIADVIKENSKEMNLEPKMINSLVSRVAVSFFKSKLAEIM